jgi:hypothetical protein
MRSGSPIKPRGAARRLRAAALAAGATALLGHAAAAVAEQPQEAPRTLDPSGRQPVERGMPPDPYAPPGQPAPSPSPAQPQAPASGEGEQAEDTGFYHYDDILGGPRRRGAGGQVPPQHEVGRGDTLWDITALYFHDPFEWPRVWALNPHITNPHWIYPGDEVRLRGEADESGRGAELAGPATAATGDGPATTAPRRAATASVALRQIAFVDRSDLEDAAVVAGAPSERQLLTFGDTIYLDEVVGLRRGQTYAIYTDEREVKHPHTGEVVGAYVRLLGEVEIVGMRDGERAVARITRAMDAVERGARVAPLVRRFASVDPVPARTDARGLIVATIEIGELVGAHQLVVIDRGRSGGIVVGNSMYVVRRGDGYTPRLGPLSHVGQDDDQYPPRIVGTIRVIEVSEGTSLGLVMSSALEVGVGDHVLMRADLD